MLKRLRTGGSLKTKLLLLFTLIIVATIIASVTVSLHVSIDKLTEDELQMNAALTRQRFRNIDAELTRFEANLFSDYLSANLEQLLADRSNSDSRIRMLKIRDAVNRIAYSQAAIDFLLVQGLDGTTYCAQKNIGKIDDQTIHALTENQPVLAGLAGKCRWSVRDGKIMMERLLYQTTLLRPAGYLMVSVSPDYFERSLRTDQMGYSALTGPDGAVFAASPEISRLDWEEFARQAAAGPLQETGGWVQGESGEFYVQSYSAPGSGWRLLCALPASYFTSQMQEMRDNAVIIAAGAILASFFCVARVISSLSQKVQLLIRRADDIEGGDFDNDIQLDEYDELAELSTRLNVLAKQIEELIRCSVEQEKRNGEVEYKCLELRYQAMQMQLNPHFVYNTLETINSLALLEGQTEISRLICRFAQMFRFSVQRNHHEVSLAEEMEYIQNYLSFYQMAYSNRVKYQIELPDSLREVRLPTAILQPLVENALVHGVEKSCRPVDIAVACFACGGTLCASVIDNGPGIERGRLEELRKQLSDSAWEPPAASASSHLSVGLYSINRLIRMRFGEEYGIKIESTPNIRTIVQISIPTERKWSETDQ